LTGEVLIKTRRAQSASTSLAATGRSSRTHGAMLALQFMGIRSWRTCVSAIIVAAANKAFANRYANTETIGKDHIINVPAPSIAVLKGMITGSDGRGWKEDQ
jgi:hypothetical protein